MILPIARPSRADAVARPRAPPSQRPARDLHLGRRATARDDPRHDGRRRQEVLIHDAMRMSRSSCRSTIASTARCWLSGSTPPPVTRIWHWPCRPEVSSPGAAHRPTEADHLATGQQAGDLVAPVLMARARRRPHDSAAHGPSTLTTPAGSRPRQQSSGRPGDSATSCFAVERLGVVLDVSLPLLRGSGTGLVTFSVLVAVAEPVRRLRIG